MHASRTWERARTDAGTAVEEFRALDPAPVTRRWPWLLALVGLTALSAWGWSLVLRTERNLDPGTPVPTTAPTEDTLFGKPVGQSPTRSA